MSQLKGWRRNLWALISLCGSFFGGGVELWLMLLNMGYYTLYEESYILEIQ